MLTPVTLDCVLAWSSIYDSDSSLRDEASSPGPAMHLQLLLYGPRCPHFKVDTKQAGMCQLSRLARGTKSSQIILAATIIKSLTLSLVPTAESVTAPVLAVVGMVTSWSQSRLALCMGHVPTYTTLPCASGGVMTGWEGVWGRPRTTTYSPLPHLGHSPR